MLVSSNQLESEQSEVVFNKLDLTGLDSFNLEQKQVVLGLIKKVLTSGFQLAYEILKRKLNQLSTRLKLHLQYCTISLDCGIVYLKVLRNILFD